MIKKTLALASFTLAATLGPILPVEAATAGGNCDCYYEAIISSDGTLVGYTLVCPELVTCQETVDP